MINKKSEITRLFEESFLYDPKDDFFISKEKEGLLWRISYTSKNYSKCGDLTKSKFTFFPSSCDAIGSLRVSFSYRNKGCGKELVHLLETTAEILEMTSLRVCPVSNPSFWKNFDYYLDGPAVYRKDF